MSLLDVRMISGLHPMIKFVGTSEDQLQPNLIAFPFTRSSGDTAFVNSNTNASLRTDKCKPLASQIPNLFLVSSVDSAKKATQLDRGRAEILFSNPSITTPLNIHIQINTSGEESKSGVTPGKDATELVKHVLASVRTAPPPFSH